MEMVGPHAENEDKPANNWKLQHLDTPGDSQERSVGGESLAQLEKMEILCQSCMCYS